MCAGSQRPRWSRASRAVMGACGRPRSPECTQFWRPPGDQTALSLDETMVGAATIREIPNVATKGEGHGEKTHSYAGRSRCIDRTVDFDRIRSYPVKNASPE